MSNLRAIAIPCATWPVVVRGGALPADVRSYDYSLSSLPRLQLAASGQGLLSTDLQAYGVVRRVPLVVDRVRGALVPSFTLELLRVATGTSAIEVGHHEDGRVRSMRVGDLHVPTQAAE